ncbi:hypothetical protein D3C84_835830 [compost metagenome]
MRGVGNHENDALVLVRCQFRLGEHEQYRNQAQNNDRKYQHHRPGIERSVEHALISALEAFENQVEAVGQTGGVFIVAQ